MDDRLIQLTAAIRMTCGAWARANGGAPVVVTVDADMKGLTSRPVTISAQAGVAILGPDVAPEQAAASLERVISSSGRLPSAVVIGTTALLAIGRSRQEALATIQTLRAGTPAATGTSYPARTGRLAGRVAVVTGSAQGFGRGIAEELARHGACVTIADVNDPLGEACARELCAQFGGECAVYAHADVTSLQSTEEMIHRTVAAFGGVDLFIANAGVLKAGSLEEMDEKGFDLVTNVNYKAFFLGTKAASRIMKAQHAFDPATYMDIIQINSKSGLQGSNKNFAYAGSKFGTIGLTQSFAMELVEYNIKVNSICPGNFFEGPLWSDPEKGLFVQYLRAGKVPGAKTIEDVKQSYVSKVPMKRGCSPVDVSRAILYVCEQVYETGQAIPVTGGQVMLN